MLNGAIADDGVDASRAEQVDSWGEEEAPMNIQVTQDDQKESNDPMRSFYQSSGPGPKLKNLIPEGRWPSKLIP